MSNGGAEKVPRKAAGPEARLSPPCSDAPRTRFGTPTRAGRRGSLRVEGCVRAPPSRIRGRPETQPPGLLEAEVPALGNPGPHAVLDFDLGHGAVPPAVPHAPQTVAETAHVLFRQAPAPAVQQDEAQEGGGLAGGRDVRLVRVKAKAPTLQIPLDPPPPLRELLRIVVEQREVVHVPHVPLRAQHFLAEVVEAIEIEVGEELAGEVADGQAAPPFEGGEQVVAGEVEVDGLLRVRAVDDPVGEVEGALAGEAAAKVALEDGVVDGGEVAVDVAAQNVTEAVAELLVARDSAWVPLPFRLA